MNSRQLQVEYPRLSTAWLQNMSCEVRVCRNNKSVNAGKGERKMRLFVILLTCFCNSTHAVCSAGEKTQSKIDYVAKWNELARQGRDEDLNAAPFYKKAAELYVKRPETVEREDLLRWPSALTNEKQSLLRQWAESNSNAFAQLKLGTQKPYYWNQYQADNVWKVGDSSNLSGLGDVVLAMLFCVKSSSVEAGMTREGAEDILTCCRFGSHLGQTPDWADQWVGMGIINSVAQTLFLCLGKTDFDPMLMDLLQRGISSEFLKSQSCIYSMLEAEKLRHLEVVQMIFQGTQDDSKLKADEGMGLAARFDDLSYEDLQAVRRGRTVNDINAAFACCKDFLATSPWQARQKGLNFWEYLQKRTGGNPVVRFCMFDVPRDARLRTHSRAKTDALVTTLAVLRYRHDKGNLPKDLKELIAAGYLSGLPMDPYSNGPLVYKQTGSDFLLYSFNEDFNDDGGDQSRWGWDEQDGDYVFWPVQEANQNN